MSKSMWCDAIGIQPVTSDDNPKGDVLFWVDGLTRPYWGHYDSTLNLWVSRDAFVNTNSCYIEPVFVKYFAYISNPYK